MTYFEAGTSLSYPDEALAKSVTSDSVVYAAVAIMVDKSGVAELPAAVLRVCTYMSTIEYIAVLGNTEDHCKSGTEAA